MDKINNAPDSSFTNLYQYTTHSAFLFEDYSLPKNAPDGTGVDLVILEGIDAGHWEFTDKNGDTRVQFVNWDYLIRNIDDLIASGSEGYNLWRQQDLSYEFISNEIEKKMRSIDEAGNISAFIDGASGNPNVETFQKSLNKKMWEQGTPIHHFWPGHYHGTHVTATAAGRSQGWASGAHIFPCYFVGNAYSAYGKPSDIPPHSSFQLIYYMQVLKKLAGSPRPTVTEMSLGPYYPRTGTPAQSRIMDTIPRGDYFTHGNVTSGSKAVFDSEIHPVVEQVKDNQRDIFGLASKTTLENIFGNQFTGTSLYTNSESAKLFLPHIDTGSYMKVVDHLLDSQNAIGNYFVTWSDAGVTTGSEENPGTPDDIDPTFNYYNPVVNWTNLVAEDGLPSGISQILTPRLSSGTVYSGSWQPGKTYLGYATSSYLGSDAHTLIGQKLYNAYLADPDSVPSWFANTITSTWYSDQKFQKNNNLVLHSGSLYLCRKSHTSSVNDPETIPPLPTPSGSKNAYWHGIWRLNSGERLGDGGEYWKQESGSRPLTYRENKYRQMYYTPQSMHNKDKFITSPFLLYTSSYNNSAETPNDLHEHRQVFHDFYETFNLDFNKGRQLPSHILAGRDDYTLTTPYSWDYHRPYYLAGGSQDGLFNTWMEVYLARYHDEGGHFIKAAGNERHNMTGNVNDVIDNGGVVVPPTRAYQETGSHLLPNKEPQKNYIKYYFDTVDSEAGIKSNEPIPNLISGIYRETRSIQVLSASAGINATASTWLELIPNHRFITKTNTAYFPPKVDIQCSINNYNLDGFENDESIIWSSNPFIDYYQTTQNVITEAAGLGGLGQKSVTIPPTAYIDNTNFTVTALVSVTDTTDDSNVSASLDIPVIESSSDILTSLIYPKTMVVSKNIITDETFFSGSTAPNQKTHIHMFSGSEALTFTASERVSDRDGLFTINALSRNVNIDTSSYGTTTCSIFPYTDDKSSVNNISESMDFIYRVVTPQKDPIFVTQTIHINTPGNIIETTHSVPVLPVNNYNQNFCGFETRSIFVGSTSLIDSEDPFYGQWHYKDPELINRLKVSASVNDSNPLLNITKKIEFIDKYGKNLCMQDRELLVTELLEDNLIRNVGVLNPEVYSGSATLESLFTSLNVAGFVEIGAVIDLYHTLFIENAQYLSGSISTLENQLRSITDDRLDFPKLRTIRREHAYGSAKPKRPVDIISNFSNGGPRIDLYAPGTSIHSAYPYYIGSTVVSDLVTSDYKRERFDPRSDIHRFIQYISGSDYLQEKQAKYRGFPYYTFNNKWYSGSFNYGSTENNITVYEGSTRLYPLSESSVLTPGSFSVTITGNNIKTTVPVFVTSSANDYNVIIPNLRGITSSNTLLSITDPNHYSPEVYYKIDGLKTNGVPFSFQKTHSILLGKQDHEDMTYGVPSSDITASLSESNITVPEPFVYNSSGQLEPNFIIISASGATGSFRAINGSGNDISNILVNQQISSSTLTVVGGTTKASVDFKIGDVSENFGQTDGDSIVVNDIDYITNQTQKLIVFTSSVHPTSSINIVTGSNGTTTISSGNFPYFFRTFLPVTSSEEPNTLFYPLLNSQTLGMISLSGDGTYENPGNYQNKTSGSISYLKYKSRNMVAQIMTMLFVPMITGSTVPDTTDNYNINPLNAHMTYVGSNIGWTGDIDFIKFAASESGQRYNNTFIYITGSGTTHNIAGYASGSNINTQLSENRPFNYNTATNEITFPKPTVLSNTAVHSDAVTASISIGAEHLINPYETYRNEQTLRGRLSLETFDAASHEGILNYFKGGAGGTIYNNYATLFNSSYQSGMKVIWDTHGPLTVDSEQVTDVAEVFAVDSRTTDVTCILSNETSTIIANPNHYKTSFMPYIMWGEIGTQGGTGTGDSVYHKSFYNKFKLTQSADRNRDQIDENNFWSKKFSSQYLIATGSTPEYNTYHLYRSISGTSMAGPQVAGVACIFAQLYPGASPDELKQMMIDNSYKDHIVDANNLSYYATPKVNQGTSVWGTPFWMEQRISRTQNTPTTYRDQFRRTLMPPFSFNPYFDVLHEQPGFSGPQGWGYGDLGFADQDQTSVPGRASIINGYGDDNNPPFNKYPYKLSPVTRHHAIYNLKDEYKVNNSILKAMYNTWKGPLSSMMYLRHMDLYYTPHTSVYGLGHSGSQNNLLHNPFSNLDMARVTESLAFNNITITGSVGLTNFKNNNRILERLADNTVIPTGSSVDIQPEI